jgi:hypothetical protein
VDRGLRGLAPQIWADMGYEAEPLPGTPWDSIRLRVSNGDIDVPIHVHPAGGYVGARFEGHWYEADIQVRACVGTLHGFRETRELMLRFSWRASYACYPIAPWPTANQHSILRGQPWRDGVFLIVPPPH